MRRIYILVLLSLSVLVGFSQVKNSNWESKQKNVLTKNNLTVKNKVLSKMVLPQKVTISSEKYVSTSFANIKSAVKAINNVAVDTLSVIYGRPDGTLFEGYTRDFRSYSGVYLHSPAITNVDYVPIANKAATYAWSFSGGDDAAIEDSVEADGTLHFMSSITPSGYISYLPKVTARTSTDSANFVIGKGSEFQYLLSASVDRSATTDGTSFDGVEEFAPLTLGNMHANNPTGGNLYGGFSAGGSFSPAYSNENGACVGVMQIIPKLKSPLYTESVSILAFEEGGVAVPAGGKMKLQFYYLKADGSFGQLIGESSTSEFVKTYETQGVFNFVFQVEEDGFIIDKPITLGTDAPIAVVITGFDATWNFKFLFAGNSVKGSSYTLHGIDHKISTFGYTSAPNVPRTDLYIQFNGIFNCLVPYAEDLAITFPAEGGWGITGYDDQDGSPYNEVDFISSYNIDPDMTNVWVESAPDWVTGLDMDTTYFADYNAILLFFEAEALPVGVTERSGEIVVSSYGVSVKIPVVQSSASGFIKPKSSGLHVYKTNTTFEVKNAQKYTTVNLLSVTGQLISTYNISTNTSISIPSSNLKSGVYFLKFNGNGTESIKIVK
ncbi:MAG: T9SS type A sorting domain-containing protein [Paludibacter sp.]